MAGAPTKRPQDAQELAARMVREEAERSKALEAMHLIAVERQEKIDELQRELRDVKTELGSRVHALALREADVRRRDQHIESLEAHIAAIKSGGWWRLREALLPVLRPAGRAARRVRSLARRR